jgi:hypothetical protein
MGWIRATAAALLVSAAHSATPASTGTSSLSGVVRDNLGIAVEGAEVLVLAPEGHVGDALLSSVSGASGRFVVGSIAPGVYRVAAIKTGYIAALGRVNTVLHSSVELVLRPVPKPGEPGTRDVLPDLSWTLRVPTRSILRELDPPAIVASRETSAVRAFASRVEDAVRGEVDHVFAVGSWRPGSVGPSSSLAGNETRMRLASALGERGAIQVRGRHGSLDSSSSAGSATAAGRGASDVDLDLSYDTSVDENLAMRAFYSAGDLHVDDRPGVSGSGARESQRSFGYDATWRKQVDGFSRVAVQVGFEGASLEAGRGVASGWDPSQGDAWNRGIGAEGSYEDLVADRHLVRLGVRAQRLSLDAPTARVGRDNGGIAWTGAAGWNLLIDSEDQWSLAGPLALTYGLAARPGLDGSYPAALTPRVGGTLTSGRLEARLAVSYVAEVGAAGTTDAPGRSAGPSPYGYDLELKTRLDSASTLRGIASYVPCRSNAWGGQDPAQDAESLYVSDGFASDRFVAVDFERVAPSATVGVRLTRGRAEGVLAPALIEAPVVVLSDGVVAYDAARITVKAPRAGSTISLGYRATSDRTAAAGAVPAESLRTVDMEFAQDLVRFAAGRASCRLLVTARTALSGSGDDVLDADAGDARSFAAEHKRIGAGVSLAF